jgi:hypothetical protein
VQLGDASRAKVNSDMRRVDGRGYTAVASTPAGDLPKTEPRSLGDRADETEEWGKAVKSITSVRECGARRLVSVSINSELIRGCGSVISPTSVASLERQKGITRLPD